MHVQNSKISTSQPVTNSTVCHRLICTIIVCWTVLSFGYSIVFSGTKPHEYEVKSAFIFNFAQFIDWPDSAFESSTSPFYIGVLGDNPFNSYLEKIISNKTLKGRKIEILYFRNFKEVKFAHILFISSSEKRRLKHIFRDFDTTGILTIGDTEEFILTGGAIGFIMKDNKVRFEINLNSVRKARLIISSKLLRLARRVIDDVVKGGS